MKKKSKKLPKNAPYEIWDNIYQAQWFIFLGDTLEEAIKSYNEHAKVDMEIPEYNPRREAYYFAETSHTGGCLWFRDKKPRSCVIAHESFHAVCVLFLILECKLNRNCEELFAYYLQYLIDQIEQLK